MWFVVFSSGVGITAKMSLGMFEDFKEKIKEQKEKPESCRLFAEVEAKLREQGLDPVTMTLDDLYPEALDPEGNDFAYVRV